jgi:hypothetical protein
MQNMIIGCWKWIRRLLNLKGISMGTKADALTAFVSAVTAGQAQALNDAGSALYDQALVDNPPGTGGGFQQSDIDAAVAAAVAPLNDQIATLTAQDASDIAAGQAALADAQSKLGALQGQFDQLTAKEGSEAGILVSYQAALAQLQQVVSALQGLNLPVIPPPPPVDPVPTPDPVPPVDPVPPPVDPAPVDPSAPVQPQMKKAKPSGLK